LNLIADLDVFGRIVNIRFGKLGDRHDAFRLRAQVHKHAVPVYLDDGGLDPVSLGELLESPLGACVLVPTLQAAHRLLEELGVAKLRFGRFFGGRSGCLDFLRRLGGGRRLIRRGRVGLGCGLGLLFDRRLGSAGLLGLLFPHFGGRLGFKGFLNLFQRLRLPLRLSLVGRGIALLGLRRGSLGLVACRFRQVGGRIGWRLHHHGRVARRASLPGRLRGGFLIPHGRLFVVGRHVWALKKTLSKESAYYTSSCRICPPTRGDSPSRFVFAF
jgi:hypothetical protein